MRLTQLLAIVLLGALAACTAATPPSSAPASSTPPSTDEVVLRIESGATASGPGVTVAEALRSDTDQPLLVNGALFIDADGTGRLCDALMESFPPQCGGDRVIVEGLEEASIADLQEEGAIRWSEGVQLLGRIER